MSRPHFLQNMDVLEFCEVQFGHFLCFRFFFSSVNVTLSRSFSTLKFSSDIQQISVLRFPESRNKERTARARSRKYSLSMALACPNASLSSVSPMTVSRLSLRELFLTRVTHSPPALRLRIVGVSCNNRRRIGEVEASHMSETGQNRKLDLDKLNKEKKKEDARVTSPL